jgi:hypothetical protein
MWLRRSPNSQRLQQTISEGNTHRLSRCGNGRGKEHLHDIAETQDARSELKIDGGHVAASRRVMLVAQHNPTVAPFMNGSVTKHRTTVAGNQMVPSNHNGSSYALSVTM